MKKDTVKFREIPKHVGSYMIGGDTIDTSIQFHFQKKPSWIHRTFCKLLLGWTWSDKKIF